MSTLVCPAGHDSAATDYCDTCGVAMEPAPSGAPAGATGGTSGDVVDAPAAAPADPPADAAPDGGAAAGSGNECPNCAASNPQSALFCESCGYDFTTGAMPRPVDPAVDVSAVVPTPPANVSNPSPAPTQPWVAEIWIDPDWYADQQSDDPLPSPGLPIVKKLEHTSLLVGRASRSRGIQPDIDLAADTGISRRHCQITTDGTRWFVEDLGSSNGTYVGGAGGTLPTTAITVGQKVEVTGDNRIYLGAWTRIVLRKAAPGEA